MVRHGGLLRTGWHSQSGHEEDRIGQTAKVNQWGRGKGEETISVVQMGLT